MKAAKFIVATDHLAGHNHKDDYIRLSSTNMLDAMAEAINVLAEDDRLYCSTLYQLEPGTNGKRYNPVARNYGHGGFYAKGCGSWSDNHHLHRTASKDFEVYTLVMGW